ncbi:hypothetical protein TVAG_430800 [Trichomonas vaginalis G3]|uniref:Uncharacterized protein n=1 Tax=Trichomonas vaginalis (strain ATCC PRA-98 / G3) TaxID=412133 RepID=A2E3A3_TRIV3|nr:hypothetical protein TVAGG3_1017570 [Trichomonas vaginalis G3]EAY12913.1 hypothetical protein TVAG_430800 [Trichomonas vaginalis G3]KAI5491916.1 hypothetical protein TVAGG3_1017570 [Trichomonas vaginalis G3]|eukprot:XP_001325136.1 hypothetical protein [Trichomonas vaginalis G3]
MSNTETTQLDSEEVLSISPIENNETSVSLSTPSLLISTSKSWKPKALQNNKNSSKRLFNMSIRSSNSLEKSDSFHNTSCVGSSVQLVNSKIYDLVNDAFGDEEFVDINHLTESFRKIQIIGPKERLLDRSAIRNEVLNWKVGDGLFDNEAAKQSIIDSFHGTKKSKYHKLVKVQTSFYLANRKNTTTKSDDEDEIRPKSPKSPTTGYNLERLLMTKEELQSERPPTARKPYVPPPEPKLEKYTSSTSQNIINKSKYRDTKLDDRVQMYKKRGQTKISKVEKQIKEENSPPVIPRNPQYEITEKEREEFEKKKREKFERSIPQYPYRPQITSWEEYERIKSKILLAKIVEEEVDDFPPPKVLPVHAKSNKK